MDRFDYIIVGAGSAGSVLANRLSEDGTKEVLVIEAGGTDSNFWVQMPIGYGKAYTDARINWKYETEPVPGLGGKSSYWPRGKVMGGSSSINAMVYVRGHQQDYDDWGAEAPGWWWSDVAPIFRRMESYEGGGETRGTEGPLHVSNVAGDVHPLCRTYLAAAAQAGIPFNEDYNGPAMEGASLYQITTKGGLRASASRCYLRPALKRRNLRLETHAHATRILIEAGRATGVEYRQNGAIRTAFADGEVLLCGGAINSPQLLQLSGIGPGALLAGLGIATVLDAPEVGRNLADHLGADLHFRARVPTLNQVLGPWLGRMKVGLQFLLMRRGPLTLSVNQGGGFVRMMKGADRPDIQLYFSPVSYTRAAPGKRALMKPDPFPGFLLGINPCKPTSRGHLAIRSADPFAPPEMHPNYLATEHDRDMMRQGLRLARRIAGTKAFLHVIDAEISPGPEVESDAALDGFIRDNAWTVFHQCGTCRMGRDGVRSVVDERLRVHGIAGLRVVDASIFPSIPTGNTNAPAIMVGERGAELILEDARNPQGALS